MRKTRLSDAPVVVDGFIFPLRAYAIRHPGWRRIALSALCIAGSVLSANAQSSMRLVIDVPTRTATVTAPFVVGGWAADLASTSGSGVDAVHVWAYPYIGAALGTPRPLGAARLGVAVPMSRQFSAANLRSRVFTWSSRPPSCRPGLT